MLVSGVCIYVLFFFFILWKSRLFLHGGKDGPSSSRFPWFVASVLSWRRLDIIIVLGRALWQVPWICSPQQLFPFLCKRTSPPLRHGVCFLSHWTWDGYSQTNTRWWKWPSGTSEFKLLKYQQPLFSFSCHKESWAIILEKDHTGQPCRLRCHVEGALWRKIKAPELNVINHHGPDLPAQPSCQLNQLHD